MREAKNSKCYKRFINKQFVLRVFFSYYAKTFHTNLKSSVWRGHICVPVPGTEIWMGTGGSNSGGKSTGGKRRERGRWETLGGGIWEKIEINSYFARLCNF